MNFHHLQSFIAVAGMGTFAKAAQSLHISPQALIQQINLLESYVGVPLFERSRKGVTLTAAGQVFYKDAKEILSLLDKSLSHTRNTAVHHTKGLNIAFFHTPEMMNTLCTQFAKQHPDVRLVYRMMKNDDWISSLDMVSSGAIDILEHVAVSEIEERELSFVSLIHTPVSCIMAANHPLSGKAHITLADLNGASLFLHHVRCITNLEEQIGIKAHQATLFSTYGLKPEPSVYDLCAEGHLYLVDTLHARNYSPLVTIPLDDDSIYWDYGIVTRPQPSPIVQAFIDAARSLYKI